MIKIIGLIIFLFSFISVAEADFDILIKHLPFSKEDKQKILQGELVTTKIKQSGDDELAVMLAFVAKTTPDKIKKSFIQATWAHLPESIIDAHRLPVAAQAHDFSKVKFSSKEGSDVNDFLSAQAGEDLNLSGPEIKEFVSIKLTGPQTDKAHKRAVEKQLQKILFNRFHEYKNGGVNAISPYLRDNKKQYFLGSFFKRATHFDSILQQYYPVFYKALINYPHNNPTRMLESFYALKLEIQGSPSFSLTHRMLIEENGALVVAMRHYYASQSYNGEQDLGLFIPIKQGVLVLGLFRTSSDSVAGFGSNVIRAIVTPILASALADHFKQVQKLLENKEAY